MYSQVNIWIGGQRREVKRDLNWGGRRPEVRIQADGVHARYEWGGWCEEKGGHPWSKRCRLGPHTAILPHESHPSLTRWGSQQVLTSDIHVPILLPPCISPPSLGPGHFITCIEGCGGSAGVGEEEGETFMDGRRLRQEGERDGCHGRWRNGGIFSSPEAEGIFSPALLTKNIFSFPRCQLKTFSLPRAANWK
jgi:hypothetical protein